MGFSLNLFITECGFEACFSWDRWDPAPKVLGSDSKNTSRIQMLLARNFDSYCATDWPRSGRL